MNTNKAFPLFKPFSMLLLLLLVGCGEQTATNTEQGVVTDTTSSATTQINEWFETKYEEELMMSPIELTFQGRKERYDEIDDMTEAAQDKWLEWKRQSVEELQANFDYASLSDDAKLSFDLWIHQYETALASEPFRRNEYVFTQMQGIHTFLPTLLLSFHKVEEVSDLEALIKRIGGVSVAMGQLLDRAKVNAEGGVRPPRFSYEIVAKQAQDVVSGAPFDESETDSSLWDGIKKHVAALQEKGELDQTQADEYLAQASAALVNELKPAYAALIAFMQEDISNTSEQAQGASALPNGEAYYADRLAVRTTTSMTADEIHSLGLSEVARIRAEMEALMVADGFTGTLQEYFTLIRDSVDDEKYYFPNTDEGRQGYIDEATAAIENIKSELPNYFGILPKADLVVKRVEPFREQAGAPQHYFSSTPDGSRPGVYYAHLLDMTAMPKNELEVIAYHEGLPGHHMQIAIAQELSGVPTFRKQAGFTAYSEGWGLYSEILAKEMPGTYTTIHSDFGRLSSEMWRAIRLVVDSGMHSKGWSEQQAIDYFAGNSAVPMETIRTEVQRYLVWPGQATSYKVGMIFIQDLRKMAETELGDQFDIRGFHDAILDGGAMPLNMLEKKVKAWVSSRKA